MRWGLRRGDAPLAATLGGPARLARLLVSGGPPQQFFEFPIGLGRSWGTGWTLGCHGSDLPSVR
jgi:hypothetical protein